MTDDLSLSDYDDSWGDINPIPPGPPPDGTHEARVVGLESVAPVNRAPAIRVIFELVRAPYTGKRASQLITFVRVEETKGILSILGLDGLMPSVLPKFEQFQTLPSVRITTFTRNQDGRAYCNVVRVKRLAKDESERAGEG